MEKNWNAMEKLWKSYGISFPGICTNPEHLILHRDLNLIHCKSCVLLRGLFTGLTLTSLCKNKKSTLQGWGFCGFFSICRFFWGGAANAGLGMGTYQLHVIACYLDLRGVGKKLNLRCRSTNCWVFFQNLSPSLTLGFLFLFIFYLSR